VSSPAVKLSDQPETYDFHEQVATLAYRLWQERGCPEGSPEVDWVQAEQQLQAEGTEDKIKGGAYCPRGYVPSTRRKSASSARWPRALRTTGSSSLPSKST